MTEPAYALAWAALRGREDVVPTDRIVRLFRDGPDQALRIPRDRELPGTEAVLRKEGNRLILESVRRPSLLEVLSRWAPLDEEIPDLDDIEPIEDVDL